jgi:hypothetical protein
MLFFKVLLEMILMAVQVKVTPHKRAVLEVQVILNLKLRTNGNKKILKRDMKKVKIDFLFSHCSQEQDLSLVVPRLQ